MPYVDWLSSVGPVAELGLNDGDIGRLSRLYSLMFVACSHPECRVPAT